MECGEKELRCMLIFVWLTEVGQAQHPVQTSLSAPLAVAELLEQQWRLRLCVYR